MVNLQEILKIKEQELKRKRKPKKKHYEGEKIKFAVYLNYHFYKGFYNQKQMNRHFKSIKFKKIINNKDNKISIFERDIKKILDNV